MAYYNCKEDKERAMLLRNFERALDLKQVWSNLKDREEVFTRTSKTNQNMFKGQLKNSSVQQLTFLAILVFAI